MAIGLLFSPDNNKKKSVRQEQASQSLTRENYTDMKTIQERIKESVATTDEDHIRVRYIKDYPYDTYRVNILRRFKESRVVKRKDGGTATLPRGLYVDKTFLVERVSPMEFIFTPALPEGPNNGNCEAN